MLGLHIDKYTCDYFIMGKISAISSFLGPIYMVTRLGVVKKNNHRLHAILPHLETFTWQNLTPAERVTQSGRPGYPPWRVTPPII